MARLPQSIDLMAPNGAAVSRATPSPTDLGLGAGAEALADYALTKRKLADEADDRAALAIVREGEQRAAAARAEREARYNGETPGFANEELLQLDAAFKPLIEGQSIGVRAAFNRRYDALRAEVGQRAIEFEGAKRAEPIRLQQKAADDLEQAYYATRRTETYSQLQREHEGDGPPDMAGYSARQLALFDQAHAAAIEGMSGPALERANASFAAERVKVHASTLGIEQEGRLAHLADATKSQLNSLANSLLTNPSTLGAVEAQIPALSAAIPAPLRARWEQEARGTLAEAQVRGLLLRGETDEARRALDGGRFDSLLSPDQKAQLLGQVERDEKARDAAALAATGNYDGDATVAPGREAATAFVIDGLEGGDAYVADDNGAGPTRFGINQKANPDLDVKNLTRAGAAKRLGRYWNQVGADKMPPALALAAYQLAVNAGPEQAKKIVAQSGGDPMRLLDLQAQYYDSLIRADPKQAKNAASWSARIARTREQVERMQGFAATREGFATDPLKYAMGTKTRGALITVPSLPVAGALSGEPDEQAAFARALANRRGAGMALARDYPGVPQRLLLNSERDYLAQQLEQKPELAPTLAARVQAALGPKGAAAFLAELGEDGKVAPTVLHIADLTAMHGETSFTRSAAQGLALRAKGATEKENSLASAFTPLRAALANAPEVLLAAQKAAEAARLADRTRGIEHDDDWYVIAAFGGVVHKGQRFGGPATVNGARTIAPAWLAPEEMDAAVKVIAESWAKTGRGPVYSNGKPRPAREVAALRPLLRADGSYWLVDRDGVPARFGDGRPLVLDFEAQRAFLAASLGARAVKDGR